MRDNDRAVPSDKSLGGHQILAPTSPHAQCNGRSALVQDLSLISISASFLERFQAKRTPVRVKKTRQIKNLEPRFDSIESEKALLDPLGDRGCEGDHQGAGETHHQHARSRYQDQVN
jgi:hypothetical protein